MFTTRLKSNIDVLRLESIVSNMNRQVETAAAEMRALFEHLFMK